MIERERRTERGNDVGEARLVHGDDIGVTLTDDGLPRCDHGVLRTVEREEVLPLVEDGRLLGVEVLGLGIGEHATAKADGTP